MGNSRLAGVAFIKVDGRQLLLRDAAKYSIDPMERETIVGMDKVHGFSEKPRAGFIESTITDTGDLSLSDFQKMTDVTVTLELANGKTIILHNAWTTAAREVEAKEATFTVRWETANGEEMKANG